MELPGLSGGKAVQEISRPREHDGAEPLAAALREEGDGAEEEGY